MAGVQPLNRLATLGQLRVERKFAKGGGRLICVSANQDAAIGEHASRRKPDGTAPGGHKFETAVYVVVLLPEPAALPSNLVGAGVGALIDHLFVWSTEIVCR